MNLLPCISAGSEKGKLVAGNVGQGARHVQRLVLHPIVLLLPVQYQMLEIVYIEATAAIAEQNAVGVAVRLHYELVQLVDQFAIGSDEALPCQYLPVLVGIVLL